MTLSHVCVQILTNQTKIISRGFSRHFQRKMELVANKLYFTVETEYRERPWRFPNKSVRLDELYRSKKGRHYGVPSIQSILVHCSEMERRLSEYDSIVYVTNSG